MNKDQLQQEILEKVKAGVKPSDLKRGKFNSTIPTPPPAPPLPPKTEKKDKEKVSPKPQLELKKSTFYCFGCRTKKLGNNHPIKVAQTDLEYNLIRGQSYSFCSSCQPKIKEFNEYDLLNDNPHLWTKYPYSSASEILEQEFGIKPKE